VLGIDREHQTIEKSSSFGSGPEEQAVHFRDQPYDPQVLGKGARGAYRLAIDPRLALRAFIACGRLNPGAEHRRTERSLDFGGNRPGAVALRRRDIFDRGAAQAAARREKRDCFEDVGLAGTVRPEKQGSAPLEIERSLPVGAEVREFELEDTCVRDHVVSREDPAHTRIGIRT